VLRVFPAATSGDRSTRQQHRRHPEPLRCAAHVARRADRDHPQRGLLDLRQRHGSVIEGPLAIEIGETCAQRAELGDCVQRIFIDDPR
jgi:hypothetical protein